MELDCGFGLGLLLAARGRKRAGRRTIAWTRQRSHGPGLAPDVL